ncbi:hypothetical protein [Streptomyces sp. NPDC096132]|uniref:hypothetical protein n=1 Tax=Streptomyces sp. NPDC096132 TaxID=3366075 RepID=UPI00380E3318
MAGSRYYQLPGGGTAVRTVVSYGYEFADQHGTSGRYPESTYQTPSWRQFTPYGAPRGTAAAS